MESDGRGVSLWTEENVLKLFVRMVAQLCAHTKDSWMVHFKQVNCPACELQQNKADTHAHDCYDEPKYAFK